MGVVRGKDFKLYRDTEANDPTGYWSSPAWSLINNIRDLKRNNAKTMADVSIRLTNVKQYTGTMIDYSLDFQMVYDNTDADIIALESAYWAVTGEQRQIPFVVLDGPIGTVGSRGVRFVAEVSKFETSEALEDAGMQDVSLTPSFDPEDPPTRVVVNAPGVLTVVS